MKKSSKISNFKFNHIVVAIEEYKDLSEIKFEELHPFLLAHELRLKQRSSEKVRKQALQTKFFKKIKEDYSKISRGKEKSKKK